MKKISTHAIGKLFAFAVVIGLGYAFYSVTPSTFVGTKVDAGTSDNISGWLWANSPQSTTTPSVMNQGVGWISMNSTNEAPTYSGPSYGVKVDTSPKQSTPPGVGKFSGYAWGENIGRILFDEASLVGCPTAPCVAQIDWNTRKVSGWAKAESGTSTGWDGWIKLSSSVVPVYGVTLDDNGRFSGYAWGSDTLGWVHFAPSVNGTNEGAEVEGGGTICTPDKVDLTTLGECSPLLACGTPGESVPGFQNGTCPNGGDAVVDKNAANDPICMYTCPTTTTPSPGTPGKKKFWQF